MPIVPPFQFVEITFKRKKGDTRDYEFDLWEVDPNGIKTPVNCTGLTVKLKVSGPLPMPTPPNFSVDALTVVINGNSASRTGNEADGKRKYTPSGSTEVNLSGIYLAEAVLTNGSSQETIPEGFAYWRVEAGENLGT